MALKKSVYRERDIALDIIKIAATVFVIKLHSGESGIFSEVFHYICGTAIPMFLMVSGALILNKDSVDFKYAGKKILNVLVIMALWCILLMAGKFVVSRELENPLKYAIGAMTQQGMLSHFWYLWMLVVMYLVSPILSRLSKDGGGVQRGQRLCC